MEHVLQDLFLDVLNMSITGSYAILFVLLVRLALKRAPKIFSYGLWSVVLFRLLIPVSFPSALSFFGLFPDGSAKLSGAASSGTGTEALPGISSAAAAAGSPTAAPLPSASVSAVDPAAGALHHGMQLMPVVWVLGAAALLCYSALTYWRLKQRIGTAILLENNIYECDGIASPCVVGLVKPRIYLPFGLSYSESKYIIKHEQIHIRRLDHIIKPLAFLTLCIHWFNPLAWVGFLLMGRDMEMSCDESVLKSLGMEIKKAYSSSLLSFAADKRIISPSPLTFSEGNAERRIRNVLKYRRLPVWIASVILLLLIIIGIGLLSDPSDSGNPDQNTQLQFSSQEIRSMAEIWAEALKTRDGKPRYEIMSEEMKEKFIAGQKERSDPWNFNIGVSSPWVTDYEITVGDGSAEILYHMTDSSQGSYDKKEMIHFGKENGKTVVTKSEDLLSSWERYRYSAATADEAMHHYVEALLTSDYTAILALTPSAELDPDGQLIWDTIKISDVKVVSEDVRESKACYQLELTIEDGGSSAFEKGIFPRWLWLVKGDQGWYAEGLMTGGAPDADWWSEGSEDPFFGSSQWATGTYWFERLLYLSPLSSSTFDYAESRMKGTQFTIGTDRFAIDYPGDRDDYEIPEPVYVKEKMDDHLVQAFEKSTFGTVSISEFKVKYRYDIFTKDNQKTNFSLYVMDNQLWLSSYADNTADKSEITMYIWKLN